MRTMVSFLIYFTASKMSEWKPFYGICSMEQETCPESSVLRMEVGKKIEIWSILTLGYRLNSPFQLIYYLFCYSLVVFCFEIFLNKDTFFFFFGMAKSFVSIFRLFHSKFSSFAFLFLFLAFYVLVVFNIDPVLDPFWLCFNLKTGDHFR